MGEDKARAVTTLLLSYVTFSMFRLSLGVAIPDIMVELSIDEFKAGILYSAPLWSTAALLTPAGYLADKFEKKSILLLGYLVLGLGVMGLALSSSYPATLAFLTLAGAGAGILVPSYYTLVGEALKNVRGFAIGLAAGVYNIGGLLGSILVGFFVTLHNWRLAYLSIAVSILCMLLLQLTILKRSSTIDSKPRLLFSKLLKTRNITICTLGIFLGGVAMFAAAAWLPTFFITVIRLDAAGAGLLLGLLYLAGAFGSILLGVLSDKLGRRMVTVISGLAAFFITLVLFLTTYPFYVAATYVIAFGFLELPYWNLFLTIAQESVSRELVSSVTGLTQTFGLIGCAVGPVLAGALISYMRLPLALIFTTSFPTLAFGLLSLTLKEKQPKMVRE